MPRVGAGDDHEVGREPVPGHRGDLVGHRLRRHEVLAVEVAAPIGKDLVLDVQRGRTGTLVIEW